MGLRSGVSVKLQPSVDILVLPPLSVKSSELQTIKTELTQIKSSDALLGALGAKIAEEQKANLRSASKGPCQIPVSRGTGQSMGRKMVQARRLWPPIPPGPTTEALALQRCYPGQVPQAEFVLPSSPLPLKMAKKRASTCG